jgi:hypothetical protein
LASAKIIKKATLKIYPPHGLTVTAQERGQRGPAVREPDHAFRYLESQGCDLLDRPRPASAGQSCVLLPSGNARRRAGLARGRAVADRRAGQQHDGLVYHWCYTANDPDEAVASIKAAGLNIVAAGPAKAAVLFSGREVLFLRRES